MDDLISRQTALNELRAWREACKESGHRGSASDLKNVIRAFAELPSAEPKIIRCKDCKFRDEDAFCTGRGFPCQLVPDDGFCDKGEKE